MKKTKIAKALLPFMLLGSPALAGSSVRSGSRFKPKKTVAQQKETLSEAKEQKSDNFQDPFSTFGNTIKSVDKKSDASENVLSFLKQEGLLSHIEDKKTIISGEKESLFDPSNRKEFAATTINPCAVGPYNGKQITWLATFGPSAASTAQGGYASTNDNFTVFSNLAKVTAMKDACLNGAGDTDAPTLSSVSSANVDETTVDVKGTSNEAGTMYYVIATSSSSPTYSQVSGNTVTNSVKNGSSAVSAATAKTFSVTGLTAGTQYYYYIVAKDAANNESSVSNGTFTTVSSNTTPTITGATASQAVNDNATISPFSGITLADADADNLSVTIALDDNAKGTLSTTTIASTSVAAAQTALRAITFNPTDNRVAPGSSETTTFTITVNDGTVDSTPNNTTTVISTSVNDAPTDIALSSTSVGQSSGTNATVGTINSTDADTGDSATYTLVAGTDDTNNASFNISGTTLRANDASALSAGTYKIRVNVNDGDANFEKVFTITVTDDAPSTVNSVSIPSNATYTSGDNLSFTVNTNENVTVTGIPRLALNIGGTAKYATYSSGSGTGALVFTYSVEAGLNDSDGIAVSTLELNSGTLKDSAGNDMTLTLNSVGDMTAVLVDSLAPTTTFNPANSASHPKNNDITITFDEAIRNTDDSEITNANVTTLITLKETNASGADVAFSATIDATKKIITINPTNDLTESQTYYVAYANVEDTVGNTRTGENITFTAAADTTAPIVTTFTPADNSTALVVDGDITVLFDENIQKGTGDIVLKKYADESEIERFDIATSTQITISGATLTINPTNNLEYDTKYYIEIDATAIDDTATAVNSFIGISGKDSWDFTTYDKLSLTNLEVANIAYTESDSATAITSLLEVVNPSTADITGATVTISSGFVSSEDVLGFTTQNGITGSFNSSTGVLTLTGTTTIANYQTALRTITYDNTNDSNPSTTNRVLDIVVTDSVATSVAVQRTIALTDVDNTPDAFTFTALTNQLKNTLLESDTATITGIENGTAISVVNGEYKIGTGAYTTIAGTINNNDTVTLRQTSSSGYSTKTTTSITVGDTTVHFDVTTKSAPSSGGGTPTPTPDPDPVDPTEPETPIVVDPVDPEPIEPETPIDEDVVITDDGFFDEDPTSDDMDLIVVDSATGTQSTQTVNTKDTGVNLDSVTPTDDGYVVELKDTNGDTVTQNITFEDNTNVTKTVTEQGEELSNVNTNGDTTVSTKVQLNNNGTLAVTFVSDDGVDTKKAAIVTLNPDVSVDLKDDGSVSMNYSEDDTEVEVAVSATGEVTHTVKYTDENGDTQITQATSQYDGTVISLLEDGTVQSKATIENDDGSETLILVDGSTDGKSTHLVKITKDGVTKISKASSNVEGAKTIINESGDLQTTVGDIDDGDGYTIKAQVVTKIDGSTITRFVKVNNIDDTDIEVVGNTLEADNSYPLGSEVSIDTIGTKLFLKIVAPLDADIVVE